MNLSPSTTTAIPDDGFAYCAQHFAALTQLLARYGLVVHLCPTGNAIPGSYWGESEAGLIRDGLYVREDTPVHSALHEACHYICMDQQRRATLHTDAGGSDLEECAVNYLQILLADYLPGVGRERLMQDMDAWGYSFRLGTTAAWFAKDALDARQWLYDQALLAGAEQIQFRCRQ